MSSIGRPPKLTPDEVVELFREYSKETKDKHKYVSVVTKGGIVDLPKERPLTIVGFCQFANIGKSTFYGYKDREEFSDIYTHVREAVEADQTEGAMLEIYNPSITARVLGLVDRQDITTDSKPIAPSTIVAHYQGEVITLTPDDLEGRE
ncbi:MAG: terminase small subunit [Rikenellaceae bacterium]